MARSSPTSSRAGRSSGSSGSACRSPGESRTWSEPDTRRLRFVHVAGATRGMDVTWRIEPTADGCRVDDRPRLPAAPARLRRRSSTAGSRARSRAGRWPRSRPWPRRSATDEQSGPRRRDEPIDMSARRRVWITGIGIITPIGTGRRRLPGGAAGRPLPGQAHRPVRPEPVPLAGRRPGRRLRPARLDAAEDRPPARPVQPVRRWSPGGSRSTTPGSAPGERRRRRPERIGIYLGSALGGIAYAEEQHERYLDQGHPAGRPEPRARGVRRRGAGQPRHRAGRARPDPLDGQLVRVGGGRARRGARRPARGPGRRGHRRRLRDPAQPARVRGVRHHPGAVGRPQRRRPARRPGRSTSAATGSSWARAPRCSCSRTRRRPARRGATPYAELLGYGATSDALPHGPAAGRRPRGRPRGDHRARRTPASTRARSTTSTPTRRRRRSATWPRRGRSRRPSASARRPSR